MNLLPNHRTRAATTVGNWPDAGPGLAHTAPLQRTASWHSWGGGSLSVLSVPRPLAHRKELEDAVQPSGNIHIPGSSGERFRAAHSLPPPQPTHVKHRWFMGLVRTVRGPGALLKHSCGSRIHFMWTKEGAELRGGEERRGTPVPTPQPCLRSCPRGPRRTRVLRSSFVAESPFPASASVSPALPWKEGVWGGLLPHPRPPHRAHCLRNTRGRLSPLPYPFMGTGHPRGGLCQGRPPSQAGQLGCGAAHLPP